LLVLLLLCVLVFFFWKKKREEEGSANITEVPFDAAHPVYPPSPPPLPSPPLLRSLACVLYLLSLVLPMRGLMLRSQCGGRDSDEAFNERERERERGGPTVRCSPPLTIIYAPFYDKLHNRYATPGGKDVEVENPSYATSPPDFGRDGALSNSTYGDIASTRYGVCVFFLRRCSWLCLFSMRLDRSLR
jgi:hypothetical protein